MSLPDNKLITFSYIKLKIQLILVFFWPMLHIFWGSNEAPLYITYRWIGEETTPCITHCHCYHTQRDSICFHYLSSFSLFFQHVITCYIVTSLLITANSAICSLHIHLSCHMLWELTIWISLDITNARWKCTDMKVCETFSGFMLIMCNR